MNSGGYPLRLNKRDLDHAFTTHRCPICESSLKVRRSYQLFELLCPSCIWRFIR